MTTGPLADVAADFARLPQEIIEAAAKRFDELAIESAAIAVGAGGVMNIRTARGPRPTTLSTRPQFLRKGSATAAIVVRGKPLGPWIWIEDGTKSHEIAPKRFVGRGKGRRLKALYGPGMKHPVSGPVTHPGTTGEQAWSRAAADMDFEIDGLVDTELREILGG
jgi:hypothetical protein